MTPTETPSRRAQLPCPIDPRSLDASALEPEHALTLPPECYSSADFFAFEQQAIFQRGWFAVGRSSQLRQAGDYITFDLAREPLVVVRQESGELLALSNVCRHRAAVMLTGEGNCGGTIVCPYHAWNYGLDGQLRGAPAMARTYGFQKEDHVLPRFACSEWEGFVFVSLDDQPLTPAEQWPRLAELLTNYRMTDLQGPAPTEFEWAVNWKVALENAVECYHCTTVHGEWHATAPTRNTVDSPLAYEDGAFATRVRNTDVDTDFTPTGKILLPPMPHLTMEERSHSTWVIIPPNLFLSLQHDNVHYFLAKPESEGFTRLDVGYLYPEETFQRDDFDERFAEGQVAWEPIMLQDIEITKRVQQGLASSGAPRGRYSWQETAVADFNRWLVERYQAAATAGEAAR
ncbi:MAG: hypothetical protein QOD13_3110 [Thermoleophilaceae bacterium]|nr:hypothetical protein [Thermoleophilaceae bacterium]